MIRKRAIRAATTVLILVVAAFCRNSQAQQAQKPLTNADIISMVKVGMPTQPILDLIRCRQPAYDLSGQAKADLYAAGGTERANDMKQIWDEMTNATIAKQTNGRGGEDAGGCSQSPSPQSATALQRNEYDAITAQRGVTQDKNFSTWANTKTAPRNAVSSAGSAPVPSKANQRNQYDAITLQRGVTQDKKFSNWANGPGMAVTQRQPITLRSLNAIIRPPATLQAGQSQTTSAQGNVGLLGGQRAGAISMAPNSPVAGMASPPISAQENPALVVQSACVKDPAFRIVAVIDNSTGWVQYETRTPYPTPVGGSTGKQTGTGGILDLRSSEYNDMLTPGREFTIIGCSFGNLSGKGLGGRPALRPGQSTGIPAGYLNGGRLFVADGDDHETDFIIKSWDDASITIVTRPGIDPYTAYALAVQRADGSFIAYFFSVAYKP